MYVPGLINAQFRVVIGPLMTYQIVICTKEECINWELPQRDSIYTFELGNRKNMVRKILHGLKKYIFFYKSERIFRYPTENIQSCLLFRFMRICI